VSFTKEILGDSMDSSSSIARSTWAYARSKRLPSVEHYAVEGVVKELNPCPKEFKQDLHREIVPVSGGPLTRHHLSRHPDALETIRLHKFQTSLARIKGKTKGSS
jgi:hypothetical protein